MNLPLPAIPVLLAQMGGKNIEDLLTPPVAHTHSTGDVYTVVIALVVVVALVIAVAAFVRRKKIRNLGTLSRSAWPASASKNQDPGGSLRQREHREHRGRHRKRREHRQRNPTLADTGGLPPRRPDDQAPPGL